MQLRHLFGIFCLLLAACLPTLPTPSSGGKAQTDAGSAPDAGAAPLGFCARHDLREQAFSDEAPSAFQRRQPAGDFSVPLPFDETFTLSERWTGCDSYIFLPHDLPISQLNPGSVFTTDLAELIANSPINVHYFFVIRGNANGTATQAMQTLKASIESVLDGMSDEDYDHWIDRLHPVRGTSNQLDGLVKSMFTTPVGQRGWAIDRFQTIRGIGSLADVRARNQELANQDMWPWEARLYSAGFEAQYFNFEATRHARLEAETVTEVAVFDGSVVEQFTEGTAMLPSAEVMAGFDTLEFEILMECPDRDKAEFNNCGAWDYLGHIWLRDAADENWLEMGRIITTYHRESDWVVDASWALAWLQEGGERRIKYEWAPSWNKQPTGVTFTMRLSNQGKGVAARSLVPLFTGGGLNAAYNQREPALFDVPEGTVKTELVVITSGHGMDTQNCAEFCAHSHHFTLGSTTFDQTFPAVGDQSGCAKTVGEGTVPNQGGTWWFGRGGWCPGREVVPYRQDLTSLVTPGAQSSMVYEAKINGRAPFDDAGNVNLRAYAVFHR